MVANLPAWVPAHVQIAASPVASAGWLTRFNQWRANTGLAKLPENTLWSVGDYDHAVYMVKNDLVTHYETPGTPYYTSDGDTAARNSNIYVSSSTSTTDEQAIDWWMQAPFHAMGMMDPRLTQTAFGSYREVKSGWNMGAAVDVLRGNSFTGGAYPVYFPGSGTTVPLATYGGGEFPDPLQACSGYSVPTGLPVFVQAGGNTATTAGSVHSFTGNGVALEHCVIDSSNASVGSYLYGRGGVILIPRQPLQTGVKYVVALTVNGVPYTWSFNVGSFISAITPCASAALTADKTSPQLSGTTVTFTATSTACANPRYAFWVQYPDLTWHLVQDFGGPTFAWNTGGLPAGSYLVHVWVNTGGYGYDAIGSGTMTLTSNTCSSALLSPSSSSQPVGATIGFTASSAGCSSPRYAFWAQYPDTSWHFLQNFGGPTFNWNTAGLPPGTYTVHVWVNTWGNGYDAIGSATVTLTSSTCSSASLSPSSSSQPAGATIGFTASSTGCSSPRYAFWVLYPDTSWHFMQNFGWPAFNWNTAGLLPGIYTVHVWVNTWGNGYDAWGSSTVTLTGCATASISPATATAARGSTINFTASSTGCSNPRYAYWVLDPGGVWHFVSDFPGATFAWNTTGLAAGVYTVHVWANVTGTGYDAIGSSTITLT